MIGVQFQGWSDKVYHYKTAGIDFKVGDLAVIKDTRNQLQVVAVTHINAKSKAKGVEFKDVIGKVELA